MLDLKAFRTLQSEAEYNAALKEVRPYFEKEPMKALRKLRTLTRSSSHRTVRR